MTMTAVVMRRGGLELIDAPIPRPHWEEVLVRTLATGICGSDLHAVSHGAQLESYGELSRGSTTMSAPADDTL
jgi:threonine dehydrogenase-like Zn-dependent dehydrogenase